MAEQTENEVPIPNDWPEVIDLVLELPGKRKIMLPEVSTSETLSAIRQALSDFQETAFATSFKWELKSMQDNEGKEVPKVVDYLNDFSELNAFLQPLIKTCTLKVTEEQYDVKKVKAHMKRLKDISQRTFLVSATPRERKNASKDETPDVNKIPETDSEEGSGHEQENSASVAKPNKAKGTSAEASKSEPLPKLDKIIKPVHLGEFFENVFRDPAPAKNAETKVVSHPLSHVIKNIYVSGWNPAPSYRRLQGDLLYIEVVLASEGTVYVTATARGFFVNRSNRTTFDPRPAANPHFSHTLFNTLLSYSANLTTAWANLCDYSNNHHQYVTGPFSQLEQQLNGFQGDVNSLPANAWLIPQDKQHQSHSSYDLFRAQEQLTDLLGADELGAPREWNDEIQSIRSLPAAELGEKIVKARLEYRIIADFTESCKKIAIGISEGLIAPLTYSEPNQSNIYVYNGIFISRAEDTKDVFKLCDGEEAARKATARDMSSQKFLKALEIEGLGTVLCTIVDYKGVRYVGQSIIPGIFQQGENCAQLMYGVLEPNKNITVKNSTFKVYQDIASKLFLAERNLPVQPVRFEETEADKKEEASKEATADGASDGDEGHVDPLNKLLKAADSNQAPPIKVDEVDNLPIDETNNSIKHIGPLESKIIKGSDGRLYAIEFMRLTPRDANYVLSDKNGSGKFGDDFLNKGDASLYPTYLLRPELINLFIHRKINQARQELINEASQKEKALKGEKKENTEAENSSEQKKAENTEVDKLVESSLTDEQPAMEIVKEEKKSEDEQAVIDEELQNSLATEYADKFKAITPQALGLQMNTNCFFHFDSDVDPEVIKKDEGLVKEISAFLFDSVIPLVTKQIREGEFFMRDCSSMCSYLHRMGINMRYLGVLAVAAAEQEKEDADLLLQGRQRIHSMPFYWYEFLVIEMIARSVKHMLNQKMRNNPLIASSPAASIVALVNHILSVFNNKPAETEGNNNVDDKKKNQVAAATTGDKKTTEEAQKSTSTNKKKKKKGANNNKAVVEEDGYDFSETQGQENCYTNRLDCLQELSKTLMERFLFEFSLLSEFIQQAFTPKEMTEDEQKSQSLFHSMLRNRISPTMLLHRISQQCGILFVARDYPFKASDAPLNVDDVVGLVPKVKSCEPDSYLQEFTDILTTSSTYLSQGNMNFAYELAQQGLNIITQITGNNHLHSFQAMDQLATILMNSSAMDIKQCIQIATKTLVLSYQCYGLESQETITRIIQLGILYAEINYSEVALYYYLLAKQLLNVVAGQHHPELANIFMRLAALYEKLNDFETALQCLLHARAYTNDLLKNALFTVSIASLYYHYGKVHEAVAYQKTGYRIIKEIVKEDDERFIESKKTLELYLRASLTAPPASANQPNPAALNISGVVGSREASEGMVGEGTPDGRPGEQPKKKKSNKKSNKGKK